MNSTNIQLYIVQDNRWYLHALQNKRNLHCLKKVIHPTASYNMLSQTYFSYQSNNFALVGSEFFPLFWRLFCKLSRKPAFRLFFLVTEFSIICMVELSLKNMLLYFYLSCHLHCFPDYFKPFLSKLDNPVKVVLSHFAAYSACFVISYS